MKLCPISYAILCISYVNRHVWQQVIIYMQWEVLIYTGWVTCIFGSVHYSNLWRLIGSMFMLSFDSWIFLRIYYIETLVVFNLESSASNIQKEKECLTDIDIFHWFGLMQELSRVLCLFYSAMNYLDLLPSLLLWL